MRFLFSLWALIIAGCSPSDPKPTFYRDILPIVQEHCQTCHREGEVAPMPLMTLEDIRPFAGAIEQAVTQRVMPPWFADPRHGHFANDRTMPQQQIDRLVAWIHQGMVPGSEKDAPKPRHWVKGWRIDTPDVVLGMSAPFEVPERGIINNQYVILPTGFTEDRYVEMAEVRPGNASVIHHIIAAVREPGSPWLRDAPPGVMVDEKKAQHLAEGGGEFLSGYAPGSVPNVLKPGQAKLIKAGSDIVLQMHYVTNGTATTDLSKIGLVFSKTPPRERVLTIAVSDNTFVIPPGAPNVESVARVTLQEEATLVSLLPHMHTRGKDFQYSALYPDGRKEVLLLIPRYDFDWQLTYQLDTQKRLPKGTVIEGIAHFDNSSNNPSNPNPSQEVRYGEQTWDEMMIGFMDVAVPFGKTAQDLLTP